MDVYEQFMLGDAILVSPTLYEAVTSNNVFLPYGSWFDLWSGNLRQGASSFVELGDTPYQAATHLRAGKIVPLLVQKTIIIINIARQDFLLLARSP